MTHRTAPGVPPAEPAPGVLVHPTADRQLAITHWLLAATPYPDRARQQWRTDGTAMLPLGGRIAAVRIPGRVLTALTGRVTLTEMDAFLGQTLGGGPVICDTRVPRYYALVPASTPSTWSQTITGWHEMDVQVLGRGDYLAVPRVDAVGPDRSIGHAYWSVPMPSLGVLCPPLAVARLIAAGRHSLEQAEGER